MSPLLVLALRRSARETRPTRSATTAPVTAPLTRERLHAAVRPRVVPQMRALRVRLAALGAPVAALAGIVRRRHVPAQLVGGAEALAAVGALRRLRVRDVAGRVLRAQVGAQIDVGEETSPAVAAGVRQRAG